ncbi:hypothetical protein IFT90_15830 [Frigoribacterium sp. CFBP 8766]|uniref:hypothetical protein n=1 Tax=Frigoribacterium sp. CFBP 8766 TaxID=2775273 RepID=UPI0017809685|nr:hypothetical protein [Frigoribacterium sp. CFBP 8766]MBD8586026.1 hypothetical protein [Frigoribacterium sp. CFBP 8766]
MPSTKAERIIAKIPFDMRVSVGNGGVTWGAHRRCLSPHAEGLKKKLCSSQNFRKSFAQKRSISRRAEILFLTFVPADVALKKSR